MTLFQRFLREPVAPLELDEVERRLGPVPSSVLTRRPSTHHMPLRSRRNTHSDWQSLGVADDLPLTFPLLTSGADR